MPANLPLPLPSNYQNAIAWWTANRTEIDEMVRFYNLLRALQVKVVGPTDTRGLQSLVISGENMILPVPVMMPAPIPDSAVNLATLTASHNALLAGLQDAGIMPDR